jgi:hypothetical protein
MKRLAFVFSLALFSLLLTNAAQAATLTVDTTADDASLSACTAAPNDCSLRGAITAANAQAGADTVNLPVGTYTLTIATTDEDANLNGDLDVTAGSDITFLGTDARTTIIQAGTVGGAGGNGIDRVFDILAGGTLSLNNLTVRNGRANAAGGGIRNGGNLTVHRTTVADNRTTTSGGGGIEILTGTTTTIQHSTISGNSIGSSSGGAIRTIGNAQLFIFNTTISGNTAFQTGGGAIRAQSGAGGLITITNCTITGNNLLSNAGGGLSNSNTMRIRNTIVAGNTALNNPDVSGAFSSGGTNLIGIQGTSTGWITTGATADLLNNTAANLGALANNGGSTDTHALLSPSSAIDAGQDCVINSSCDTFNAPLNLRYDQRLFVRIAGGDRSTSRNLGGAVVDIGAFEFNALVPTAASVSIGGRVSFNKNSFLSRATVTLTDMQGTVRTAPVNPFGYYKFEDVSAGQIVTVQVSAKGATFAPQVVTVNEDIENLDFTAQ